MDNTQIARERFCRRALALISFMIIITVVSVGLQADTGTCGGQLITLPFTDVPAGNTFFCSIAEAYFSALTNGTTPTTYSPSTNVTRDQMAAFITRTMDQSLKRGSKRAAMDQYWTTEGATNLALTTVGAQPLMVRSDGDDLWVTNFAGATVSRVKASDGKLLQTWSGATSAYGVLVAMGKIFVTGETSPGKIYQIDPTQAAGLVIPLSSMLGLFPQSIAFDGQRIWTANFGSPGSVSIVSLSPTSVNTVTTGFSNPTAILYDGTNIWVVDSGDSTLKRLDSNGAITLSVPMGANANSQFPAFDGTNIWVPNLNLNTLVVVRATGSLAGTVLATLTGNGLNGPIGVAFDGERILSTNLNGSSVSLWKASDFTPIGTVSTGASTNPYGVCSDGLNFWVALSGANKLARF